MHYYICLIIFLSSCATKPLVVRDNFGYNYPRKSAASSYSPIRKKIGILTFHNEAPIGGEDLAIYTSEELRRTFAKTSDFVIDSSAESIFGTSKEVFSGGGMKLAQLTKKAKISGINLIIFGRILEARIRQKSDEVGLMRNTKSYAEVKLELRVYDVHSGKELMSDQADAMVDDAAFRFYLDRKEENQEYRRSLLRYAGQAAVRKFIPKVQELGSKLDWIGRVAKIIGSKIYINAGRDSGVNIGDIMKVVTEGQEIYDPETGALLGISKGDMKGTLEIIDYFGPDGATAVLHSGGSVTEGDFVELY